MRYRTPFQIRVPENPKGHKALGLAYEILRQEGRVQEDLETFTTKLRAKQDLRILFGYCTNGAEGKKHLQEGAKVGGEEPRAVSVLVGYECHDDFGLEGELDGIDGDWVPDAKPFYLICRTLKGYQERGIIGTLINYVDGHLEDYTHLCAAEGLSFSAAKIFSGLGFEDFERSSFEPPKKSVDTLVGELEGLSTSDERASLTDEERVRWIRRRLKDDF